ncbi:unnamed protein product [Heterobilharzia americana]|nr:unnamed protein product [Heterobilharzia americana]CAH8585049.1 unnamed protein product [Heterobilharzia americana]
MFVNLHRLRWLGYVLHMPSHCLPRHTMLSEVGPGWKKARGGQTKTWYPCMKSLTVGLRHMEQRRPVGWGLWDKSKQWLETLSDMAENRCHWCRCIHTLSSSESYT